MTYLTFTLAGLITSVLLVVPLLSYGGKGYRSSHIAAGLVGVLISIITAAVAMVQIVFAYHWFAAGYQVDILNREYGTSYTQEEIFFAKDMIEAVRQLNRNRYEVNGNILNNPGEKK